MKFRIGAILLGFVMLISACSTGSTKEPETSSGLCIYYLNKEENALVTIPYETETTNQNDLLEELIDKMTAIPDNAEHKAPLHMGFSVVRCYVEGTQIVVSVDEHYRSLSPTTEILIRAAIVRTLTQVDGIECVSMLVGTEALTDTAGNPVGPMSADTFIDNEGSEINAYEQATVRLYFANETGDSLIEISQTLVYNSNISMEKLVVEQLITGPNNTETFPTINPETKI